MNFKNPVIGKLYDYLSRKSREAYRDELLISNVVLNKQDTRAKVLETYLAGETPLQVSFLLVVRKTILYLVKNLIGLVLCLITALLHRLSGQKFFVKEGEDCVMIDTFLLIDRVLDEDDFSDSYFPGLSEYLLEKKIEYVYILKGFRSNHFLQLFRVFRILKKSYAPVLTQFQVLNLVDYLDVLRFIFLYPFSIFRFTRKLGSTYEDKIIYGGLWNALDGVAFESYMRYLFAKRLVAIKFGKIKCISWYENHVADKNFYRGLRTRPGKARIIGANLGVRPYSIMNQVPDEQEIPFNVVPDKILFCGPGYCVDLGLVDVGIGPALRCKHLFNIDPLPSAGEIILVALPYHDYLVRHILEIISEVDWPKPVKVKFHPTMNWRKYECMIPRRLSITSESVQKLLSQAYMVVGECTGVLVEAASLGIPAINISKSNSFSHDYFPEIGKGIIWDQTEEVEEVRKVVTQFEKILDKNPERLKEEGVRLRAFCFAEPTDELIGQAFELE